MSKSKQHSLKLNRRTFLQTTALAAGAVAFGVPTLVRGQNLNSKLNIAAVGIGGKGSSDIDCSATENIVALCDVDTHYSAGVVARYPQAKFYGDYRKMFDEMGTGIDGVIVATPDHMHAIVASAAMRQGKHVYCQKPLTQTIYEARYLRNLAHDSKVVTQMGNQGSAADGLRRAIEIIQSGVIGNVSQVHVWSNRPVWPQGMNRPEGEDAVPDTLNWDSWLGPAPVRPFKKGVYQPFKWRGWLDFGTGALGDMACHTVNMPFRSLALGYPTEIEATPLTAMNGESYPFGSKIRFEFPARSIKVPAAHPSFFHRHDTISFAPTTLWWYDGGMPDPSAPNGHDFSNKPPKELLADIEAFRGEVPNSACLLIGDKGTIFSPDDYGEQFFIKLNGEAKYVHYKKHPAVTAVPFWVPRNIHAGSSDLKQHQEWIAAIKAGKPEDCFSRFAIGASLTEIMLLGCVSLRVGKKLDWDGPNMVATNAPEAAPFIKRDNRPGWTLS